MHSTKQEVKVQNTGAPTADALWAFQACVNNWTAKGHSSAQLLEDDQP